MEKATDELEQKLAKSNKAEVKESFTGIAFVCFETEQMKARVLEENNPSFIEKYILRKKHIPLVMDYLEEDGSTQ